MNIKEIADMAGVSRATVSRYLNDGYVSEEKRERIRRVIEETGYQPSSQAQTLRTRKTKLVGVILPKINSDSVSRMVAGISDVLNKNNYRMILANTANQVEEELKYLALFQENQVDGVILIGTIFTKKHLKLMKDYKVPIVVLGQKLEGYACVYQDEVHACRELTEHMLPSAKTVAYIGVTQKAEAADGEKQAESSGSVKEEKRPASAEAEKTAQAVKIGKEAAHRDPNTVYSPLKGTAIPLAGEILGKGMAVIPKEGVVKAPFDGEVMTFFETKHAVGLTSENGMEILIHVGINTVELKGQYYTAHVKEGDSVKAGQVLLTFDPDGIKKAGYDVTTPVIVTNTDDYTQVKQEKTGETDFMEPVLTVSKE